MEHGKLIIKQELCLVLSLLLLRIPAVWVISWIIAVLVHESFHYFALYILDVDVYEVKFGLRGAEMNTAPMSVWEELISAAFGPVGGFLLYLVTKNYPVIRFCALIQTVFNLLPLYPLDGGRVIFCFLQLIWNRHICEAIMRCLRWIVLLTFVFVSVLLCTTLRHCVILLMCIFVLWARTAGKISCKQPEQIVQ